VTLLFSDIEGSTLLLQRLGPKYVDALDGQRRVLRSAWVSHEGIEMGTEGDSFFVAFSSADMAVRAACQAQRQLAAFPWPGGEQVRVRMGMHTGSPLVHEDGYVGIDVHRAARIAGAAHGGQVVLSASTHDLVVDQLDDDLGLVDLGFHQLKDLPAVERLFQVRIAGLAEQFPPLKSLGTSSSLPTPDTALVGRDGELAELTSVVGDPAVRVLTLTGPGGSGKTRLAIGLAHELSARFPDGVYFVPLSEETTSRGMWAKIADVLDVPATARKPPELFSHLAERDALLVLDNLEQLGDAGDVVAELMHHAPGIRVVATSRAPLHVRAEYEHPVPPLLLPRSDDLGCVQDSGAVQLFTQYAQHLRPGFAITQSNAADVAAICRRLDGLPLALELAAARVKLLGPHALVAHLNDALDLKARSRDVPGRQQTLRETIDWSYKLLAEPQQALFRHLGVFSGGADVESIAAVTTVGERADDDASADLEVFDLLDALVDASMVNVSETSDGEPRFWLLETIRAFARDRMAASGELETIRRRHANCFADLAERLDELLRGPRYMEVFDRFTLEHDNLREALAWGCSVGAANDDGAAARNVLRICCGTANFMRTGGFYTEETMWLERAVPAAGSVDDPLLAQCMVSLAWRLLSRDAVEARQLADAGIAMWRRIGDRRGLTRALVSLSSFEINDGRLDAARAAIVEADALANDVGDPSLLSEVLAGFAGLEVSSDHFELALDCVQRSYDLVRDRNYPIKELQMQHERAWILRRLGRPEEALKSMHAAIQSALVLGFAYRNGLNFVAEDYAGILAELDDAAGAARLMGAVDARRESIGMLRDRSTDDDIAGSLAKAQAALTDEEWSQAYQLGRSLQLEDALTTAETWRSP
jgi:predicted ATPase/class 3 adenylate cyclase